MVLVDTVMAVDVLSHIVLLGELITGVGSTITVLVIEAPGQEVTPGPFGVIIYVTVTGDV